MARVQLKIEDTAQRMTLKAMLEVEGHTIGPDNPDVAFSDSIDAALSAAAGVPSIVLATASEVPEAVRAMREGVWGYLFVPLQAGEAALMVQRALASRSASRAHGAATDDPAKTLAQVELEYIKTVLRACKFNQAQAARVLGIGRNTLWRKLKKDTRPVKGDAAD